MLLLKWSEDLLAHLKVTVRLWRVLQPQTLSGGVVCENDLGAEGGLKIFFKMQSPLLYLFSFGPSPWGKNKGNKMKYIVLI